MSTYYIIGICVAALYLFLICPRLKKPDASPFLRVYYAHRGLHNEKIPENSLTAFRRAAEHGFGIELDVQLSADGMPVVFHDFMLSRMCAIDRRVDELTFAQLQELTLENTEEKIPSLSQVLSLVDGRVPLLIEIKMDHFTQPTPRIVNSLLRVYNGPYCVQSFHPAALYWYRRHRPDVLRGQLSTHFNAENRTLSPLQWLLGKMVLNFISRPDFISYNWVFRWDLSRILCCRVFRAHSAGWVIRSKGELATCKKPFQMYIFEDFMPAAMPAERSNVLYRS